MENSILGRFKTLTGSGKEGVAGLEHWGRDDLEESLAKLEHGQTVLQESLEKVNAAKERLQEEGAARGKIADLDAHAERLKENQADVDLQIELLQRAEEEPAAVAPSEETRRRVRDVLNGTPVEMARIGHVVYLVDEWFFERQPGEKAGRRKEVESLLQSVQAGSMRSRN